MNDPFVRHEEVRLKRSIYKFSDGDYEIEIKEQDSCTWSWEVEAFGVDIINQEGEELEKGAFFKICGVSPTLEKAKSMGLLAKRHLQILSHEATKSD